MKNKIMNSLKEFYLEHREAIHLLIVEQKTREVCDTYYFDGLSYREISRALALSIHEVSVRMMSACSIMIQYKDEICNKSS